MAKKTHKASKLNIKKGAWFVALRGSYIPCAWQGWLTYIPFTAYLIFAVVMGWQETDNPARAILFIVPNWVAAAAVMTWVARRTS